MKYTSQLAMLVGKYEEDFDLSSGNSLIHLFQALIKSYGTSFESILLSDDQTLNDSLLVVIDGNQVADKNSVILKNNMEVMLMSPISGG